MSRPEHTRRPSVRFETSPLGGSRHRRSDSGVGSLSDYDTLDADADRADRRRSTGVSALQLALEREQDNRRRAVEDLSTTLKDVEKWKKKAVDADNLRLEFQRELTETKGLLAAIQGRASRTELLDEENRDLKKEIKKLVDANAALEEKLAKARKKLDKYASSDDSPSPPSAAIRGGSGAPNGAEKIKHRRASVSHKGSEAEKEKEKLRSRFDRSDRSDTSNDTGNSTGNSTGKSSASRRRRDSTCYIEPMGHGAPRPTVPMPPSPTRRYSTYTTSQTQPPQFTNLQAPVVGQVPRSVHPTVTYTYDEHTNYKEREDGNYNIHPLPRR
ncbi:hypothetical protein GQ53DRAFT_775580 [Thozetella sp. PMI_491]|nr:hypothetical protein GQ53DRAFT_775580 [Thozetella sp. PMI_491]